MTKKKIEKLPMTGEELYKQTKCTWRMYLEAALAAGTAKGVNPTDQLKEFREMCLEQAVKELGYGQN